MHRVRGLDAVAVHRNVLVVAAPAVLTRALVLYPVLLHHVAHLLELLERQDEAVQEHADLVLGRHPRRDRRRALLLTGGGLVALGKMVAGAAAAPDLHLFVSVSP